MPRNDSNHEPMFNQDRDKLRLPSCHTVRNRPITPNGLKPMLAGPAIVLLLVDAARRRMELLWLLPNELPPANLPGQKERSVW